MESVLLSNLTAKEALGLCAMMYIIVKILEWCYPKIKKLILRDKQIDDTDHDILKRLTALELKFADVEKKVNRDYYTIEEIKKQTKDSLEEREILMRSTLAVLKGLQEIGANGPTRDAQSEIEAYLTKKAHSQ